MIYSVNKYTHQNRKLSFTTVANKNSRMLLLKIYFPIFPQIIYFLKLDMSKVKHPFIFYYATGTDTSEYLGTDGLPTAETYNLYVRKCEEFKLKARRYARDNLSAKNSTLHQPKYGYTGTKEMEEEVMMERAQLVENYETSYDITSFNEDPNAMYDSLSAKSKRIRIIRELHHERNEEFSSDFDKKKGSWFTRYCILSRFIEAARSIILLNRLTAVLAILKTVTPQMIREIEGDAEEEEEEEGENEDINEEKSEVKILPCTCD